MIRRWFLKWLAFFRPVPGWKQRLLAFRGGKTAWEVPGRPKCNMVIPWPLAWVPHRVYDETETLTDAERARGFEMFSVVCVDTSQSAKVGDAVNCARCGVGLHPDACRTAGFKPPACKRCAVLISLVR